MSDGYPKLREFVLPARSGGAYTWSQSKVWCDTESCSP